MAVPSSPVLADENRRCRPHPSGHPYTGRQGRRLFCEPAICWSPSEMTPTDTPLPVMPVALRKLGGMQQGIALGIHRIRWRRWGRNSPRASELPGVLHVGCPPLWPCPSEYLGSAPHYATGSVDTQGDTLLACRPVPATPTGITGKGVSVGVISDATSISPARRKSGDLPPVSWMDPKDAGGSGGFSSASTGDEGTP